MHEFDIIQRFFKIKPAAPEVLLGVGDDAALLQLPPNKCLAMSSDAFVQDVHFFADAPADAVGHKALAVNLSDMAAMGARPVAFTLALGLPPQSSGFDGQWIAAFSKGLLALADEYGCALIGGDTTRSPVAMATVTVLGALPQNEPALLRSGAQVGDTIWVTGTANAGLGDARLFLEAKQGTVQLPEAVYAHAKQRMERPSPRVAMGQALRGVASAALDLSDGALTDVQHILTASSATNHTSGSTTLGAEVHASAVLQGLFTSETTRAFWQTLPPQQQLHWQLNAGDDYELLFTATPNKATQVQTAARQAGVLARKLGVITASADTVLRYDDGKMETWSSQGSGGFAHF